MNKSIYFVGTLAFVLFIYTNYTPTSNKNKEATLLFQAKTNKKYALIGQEYKSNFVGTYKSTTPQGDKELILDSTYTYAYVVYNNKQAIVLKGTWELSYKDSSQHIILNSPTSNIPKKQHQIAALAERKFKVNPNNGLTDVARNEFFIKEEIENQALAVYQ